MENTMTLDELVEFINKIGYFQIEFVLNESSEKHRIICIRKSYEENVDDVLWFRAMYTKGSEWIRDSRFLSQKELVEELKSIFKDVCEYTIETIEFDC